MRHRKSGRKLGRTSSHKKALMRTLASELFEHKRIHTTLAKAKELRPYSEKLITKAKKALSREQQGLLPDGSTIDVHTRRIVYKDIRKKHVLELLFDEIAPAVMDRNGGYTRIVKTGRRRGDGGEKALIELVDWNTDQDNSFQKKKHNKSTSKGNTQVASAPSEKADDKKDSKKDNKKESAAAADENLEEVVADPNVGDTETAQEYIEESKGDDNEVSSEEIENASSADLVGETTGEVETEDTADTDATPEAVEEAEPVGVSNDSDFEEVIESNDGTPPAGTTKEDETPENGANDEDEQKQN